ncbi:MAG TPA: hypothetical protein VF874_00230 [Mycobacterium sp.]
MEVREDVFLPELGDFRWLTVGPPGQDESTRHEVLNLVAKGFAGTVFLTTDNCQATYDKMKVRPATAFASASRSKSLRADHDSPSERWWVVGGAGCSAFFEFGEQPPLASEELLVDGPFGGDTFVALLLSGAPASRQHQPASLPWLCGELVDHHFACRRGQDRKNRLPPGLVV